MSPARGPVRLSSRRVGIDVGGTKAQAVVLDPEGTVHEFQLWHNSHTPDTPELQSGITKEKQRICIYTFAHHVSQWKIGW